MKKTKILTVLGVLLAMGITACGGQPASESKPSGGDKSSSLPPASDTSAPAPQKDATGHAWGADTDVAASGEGVAYKKAECAENDGFIRITINQSKVTYADGSKRKDSTPEGYTKLDGNNQSMSVKFNYDSYAEGKLYLFGCMDGWKSNSAKNAFSYNGSPNIKVTINEKALDIAALKDVVYTDFLSGEGEELSDDGYGCLGDIAIEQGVNEIVYTRLASMNTLIKDFVLVVKNAQKPAHTHTADTEWHKDATNHWHECTAGDGEKMNSAAHTFGNWEEHASAQPCKVKGTKTRACTVCGYEQTEELDLAEHTWVADESKTDIPATCIAGKHFEKCSVCGETQEVAIPKDPDADHDFGAWETVTEPSCKQGQKKRVCSRCGMEDFAVIPPVEGAEHQWGEETVVPGEPKLDENGDPVYVTVPAPTSADANATRQVQVFNYVGYTKKVCETCGSWKVTIDASTATLAENSAWKAHKELEDYNIHGMKLKSNNNSFSYKFKFSTRADVFVYQVGCMDGGSGNLNRNYFSRQDNQDKPNFEFRVNGKAIDLSERHDEKFGDFLSVRPDDDPLKAKNYSTFNEVPIGEAELVEGDNEFVYERLESFNLIITDIVLVVTPVDHEHEAGENWVDTDPEYHWKNCTHSDGHKMEKAKHDYTGQEWEIVEPSTCTVKGTHRRSCRVCGHWQVEEMDLAPHAYEEDTTQYVAPTHNSAGKKVEVCSVCGDVKETILPKEAHEFTEGTAANNSDGFAVTPLSCSCGKVGAKMAVDSFTGNTKTNSTYKFDNNTTVTYKVIVSKAGNYELKIGAFVANNRTKDLSVAPYTVKLGEGEAAVNVPVSSGTYEELGIGTNSAKLFVLCPTITLAAGENVIALSQGGGGYRLTFGGELQVIEL